MPNITESRAPRAKSVAVAASVARLFAAFPSTKTDMLEGSTQAYASALADLPDRDLRDAIDDLIRTERYLPAVAAIRERAEALGDRRARPASSGDERPFVSWTKAGDGLRREGESDEEMTWRIRVRHWHERRRDPRRIYWPDTFGPRPDRPGCRVPASILREFQIAPIVDQPRGQTLARDAAE